MDEITICDLVAFISFIASIMMSVMQWDIDYSIMGLLFSATFLVASSGDSLPEDK